MLGRLRARLPAQPIVGVRNMLDGARGWLRGAVAPRSLCGAIHPDGRLEQRCDRRRGHSGNHMDRRSVGAWTIRLYWRQLRHPYFNG